jgi:hypothetical protein
MASRKPQPSPEQPTPGAVAHGASRMTWVYRNRGRLPLAVGWLYTHDDGSGRAGLIHRLVPQRHLAPGRYDLMFARYGVTWPVTLRRDEGSSDPRSMIVEGRIPL